MKKLTLFLLLGFCAMPLSAQLSQSDKDFAIKYLKASQNDIVTTAEGLTSDDWNYTPEAGGWSASNCLEHILVTEEAFFGMLQGGIAQGSPDPEYDNSMADAMIIGMMANRGTKVKTAPQFEPSGRWDSKQDMLDALAESRTKLISFLENTNEDLRHYKMNTPMGEVDAYQLFLIMAAHGQRHTFQMKEALSELASN
jgi:uncharacterized damage-inducible protein DinB